jgi:hypothetical protein
MPGETVRFCNNCDLAVSTEQLRRLRLDLPCPRCGRENLVGNCYRAGSETHRRRRRHWELGEVEGAPLPARHFRGLT